MKDPARSYRFGEFTLQTGDRRLSRAGQEIYLRPKTYDTLLYVVERQGHLVSKDELLEALWPGTAVTENALTRCIKEVRAALGDDVQSPGFVRTVPRLGYEFIAPVESDEPGKPSVVDEEFSAVRVVTTEEESDAHPCGTTDTDFSEAERAPRASAPQKSATFKHFLLLTTAVIVTAFTLLLTFNFDGVRDRLLGRASSLPIGSIAVLPLQNLTGDNSQEYFADGMTEELIATLGKSAAVRVISRTSVMKYKKTEKSLPQIAKELNVDAVIEGSVARDGNRVRITTQLIRAVTDTRLWGKSYERDLRDVFSLQSEVAHDISEEIRAELVPAGHVRLVTSRPVNPEAYALYLQGRALWSRDREPDNRAAIVVLERSVTIDPGFAPAFATLGRAYSDRLFAWEPKDEWKRKAEEAIDKALALDTDLAEAHVSRAALLFTPAHGWQYDEAIQECKRALAMNPSLAEGHLTLGVIFFHVGLLDEAIQEFRAAAAISPSLAEAGLYTGFSLMFEGRYQEALPFFRSVPASSFSLSLQAYDLWEMGRKDEASAIIRELLKSDPQENFVLLAAVHTLLLTGSENADEVEKRIKEKILPKAEILKPYGHFHHVANFVAEIYAQLNRPEQAMKWLETTVDTGFPCYPFLEHDRALDPIRNDPRFIALIQKSEPQWESLRSKYAAGFPR